MYLSYFDESGDDGYPLTSSNFFVLTSLYFHESVWKENYTKIVNHRKYIKEKYNFPIKFEMHSKEFVSDKNPFHGMFTPYQRRQIIYSFCVLLSSLDLKAINVVINKKNINRDSYDVLKNALTYNVQRIENDLNYLRADAKFMIITDEGRISKMRQTTRMIQKINYIPSQFSNDSYRKEIKNLIEDPMPKKSSESYFIQLADMLCFIISLYAKRNLCSPNDTWNKRILNVLNYGDEIKLLDKLKPILNLKASRKNAYGIVCYP